MAAPSLTQAAELVFQPFQLGGLSLKNRIIKAATHDGGSFIEMKRVYGRLSRNDVAMVTVAYLAISEKNKTFDNQHHISSSNVQEWKSLCDSVHSVGGRISAQLHHPGLFCMSTEGKLLGPSFFWLPSKFAWPHTLSVADLAEIKAEYTSAARLCLAAGFDCIELHCGHGYLLSQFLSPIINRRNDQFGGSVEKRAQFPLDCILAIREVVGGKFPLVVKMNAEDGFWGGLKQPQAIETAVLFAKNGVDAIVPSFGFTSLNGFGMLRGAVPMKKMAEAMPPGSKWLASNLGKYVVPQIEYESLFLRSSSKAFVEALRDFPSCKVIYIGGADSLLAIAAVLGDGCAGVQLGRPLLREPYFARRLKLGELQAVEGDVRSKCIRCNHCTLASIDPVKFPAGCHLLGPSEGKDIEDLAHL